MSALDEFNSDEIPLLIFYDCECSSSEHLKADIIEIAARCVPEIQNASFESLISTSQDLGKFTIERCGIRESDLEGKPAFPIVFKKFLKWIEKLVLRVNLKYGKKHFPVLCAHGGYGFDFPILLSNMRRYKVKEGVLKNKNLHFADTFLFCKKLQEDNHVAELQGIRLSMDSLFSEFAAGKEFLNRHRAMGDVNAMVEIFTKEPFKTAINNIEYATSESLWEWFATQNCQKEQRIILEEKMVKLDAFTRNVYSKKLFQLQLSYDMLQSIFENCCSYMDFYAVLQDRGINRKTAKYFACQFGGMGLKNQGTEPYCPKSAVTNSEELDYSPKNAEELLAEEELKKKAAPNVPPLPNETTRYESLECWEDEIDETRSFTFTVPKPEVPLSLTIDDFVSPAKPVTAGFDAGTKSLSGRSYSKKNVYKQRSNFPGRQNGRQVYDQTDGKNDPASRVKTRVSRNQNQNSTVPFRDSSSSLQSGKVSDKEERCNLENQLLDRIGKDCDESDIVNNETHKENKEITKNTNVKESSKNNRDKVPSEKVQVQDEKETTRAASNDSRFLSVRGNPKDSSENYQTSYKNFPRKFVGITRRDPRNSKKFDGCKQASFTSSDKFKKKSGKDSQDTISSPKRESSVKQLKQAVLKKPPQCNVNKLSSSVSKTLGTANVKEGLNGLKAEQRRVEASCDSTEKIKETDVTNNKERCQEGTTSVRDKEGETQSTIIEETTKETTACFGGGENQQSSKTTVKLNGLQDTKLLQGDMQDVPKSTVTNLNEKHREKEIKLKRNTKKTSTFVRRRTRNREPVVFVCRKSTDEKQKLWPRLEIFVGDLPIYVPVEPTEAEQSNTEAKKTIGFSLEDNPTGTGTRSCETNSASLLAPGDVSEGVIISNGIQSSSYDRSSEEQELQIFDENEVERNKVTHSDVDSLLRDVITSSPLESNVVLAIDEPGYVVTSEMKSGSVNASNNETIPPLDDSYVEKTSNASHVTQVETTDSSQQTMLDLPWEKNLKRFVDEEQQSECAVQNACHVEMFECVEMMDKGTSTDRSLSERTQTIDRPSHSSISSSCLPDSQYEIVNAGECESPTRIFHSLLSDERFWEKDVDGYHIPSPNEFQQIYRLGDINPNYPSDPHRIPRRYLNTSPFPPLLPQIYPLNSNHGSNPPVFHPRYPQPSRMPRSPLFYQQGPGIYRFHY